VTVPTELSLRWLTAPEQVDDDLRQALTTCWRDVSNAGGAVGFPFLPVTDDDVAPVLDEVVGGLHPTLRRVLVAEDGGTLAGWLVLTGNEHALRAHWARVNRVQTAVTHRGTGVGRLLMTEVARTARVDLGLAQLHLEVRAGMGTEPFYERLGWQVVGRWPRALRLSGDDLRDEILMYLDLSAS